MKHNIKNRPKNAFESKDGLGIISEEYAVWFKEFEKELREGLNIHKADAKGVCCRKLITEILGEEG